MANGTGLWKVGSFTPVTYYNYFQRYPIISPGTNRHRRQLSYRPSSPFVSTPFPLQISRIAAY